jgi:hypothetical protein
LDVSDACFGHLNLLSLQAEEDPRGLPDRSLKNPTCWVFTTGTGGLCDAAVQAPRDIGQGTNSRADFFEGAEGICDSTDGRWEAGSAGNMEQRNADAEEYFTQAEAAERKKAREQADRDRRGATPQEDVGGSYWVAHIMRPRSTVETRRPLECSSFDFGTGHPNCVHSTEGF